MKRKIILSFIFLLCISLITGCTNKSNDKDKDKSEKEETTYEISFKVNPLVKFRFKYSDDVATIIDFEYINDKAKELFKDIDFKNMELNKAIDLYGDTLKKAEIEFSTINIITTWSKTDYFKSEKYNLNVKKVDSLDNIEDLTKPKLLYDKKYYLVGNDYDYNITFHEDGSITFYQDKDEERKLCDSLDVTDCEIVHINAGEVDMYGQKIIFEVDDNIVYIKGKTDMDCYQGWCRSYDKCDIEYNRLKCDYYSGFSGLEIDYRWTTYFEIRN